MEPKQQNWNLRVLRAQNNLMGDVKEPPRSKFFVSTLSVDVELLRRFGETLSSKFGEIEEEGPIHPWNYSPNYSRELGDNIKRKFFVFRSLGSPEDLPGWKIATNAIENQYLAQDDSSRKINIDPGYLNGSQVIFASTKRYHNRIYLRDGIYGDLTLYYDGKSYKALKGLTFPDYRNTATIGFFNRVRQSYMLEVRGDVRLKKTS